MYDGSGDARCFPCRLYIQSGALMRHYQPKDPADPAA